MKKLVKLLDKAGNELVQDDIKNKKSKSRIDAYSCDYINDKFETQYIVATISTPQEISSNYVVNLDKIAYQNGNKLTLQNGKIKIGNGVSKIRVSAIAFVDGWAGDNSYIWTFVRKNQVPVSSFINSGSANYISGSVPDTIIDVEENDVIDLVTDATSSSGKLRTGQSNTQLFVEVIN